MIAAADLEALDRVADKLKRTFARGRAGSALGSAWRLLRPVLERLPVDPTGRRDVPDHELVALRLEVEHRCLTLRHRAEVMSAINRLLHVLAQAGHLHSGYLRVPHQVPRRLITHPHALSPGLLERLEALADRLANPRALRVPQAWPWPPELWYFLVFLASAVFCSHLVIPKPHQRLVHLRPADLALPGWLTVPEPAGRTGALVSCPMAPATQRALDNLLGRLRRGRHGRPRHLEPVLPSAWRDADFLRKTLRRAWPRVLETLLPAPVPAPLKRLDALPRLGVFVALLHDVPPALIAARTGMLPTQPLTQPSLRRALALASPVPDPTPPPPRRGRPPAPRHGRRDHLFEVTERIRLSLRREATPDDCRAALVELERVLAQQSHYRQIAADEANGDAAWNYNTWCYARWVAELLDLAMRGKIRPGTVNTRASAVAAAFPDVFAGRPFATWTGADWAAALRQLRSEHETAGAAVSVRAFRDLLVREGLTPDDPLPTSARPRAARPRRARPLIDFEAFEQAKLHLSRPTVPPHLSELLRTKLRLGFWAGLRSREATRLRIDDLATSPRVVLHIRDTKTRSGVRNLPLEELVPASELQALIAWRARRLGEACGDAPLLATPAHPGFHDSSYLASLCGLALRRAVGEPVCFHDLRHAFASWFLIRWAVADRWVALPERQYGFARAEVFQRPALDGVRALVYGFRPSIGQRLFPHVMAVLAHLLGHGSPATSLSTYCHSLELLEYLILHHGARHRYGRLSRRARRAVLLSEV